MIEEWVRRGQLRHRQAPTKRLTLGKGESDMTFELYIV